MNVAIFTDNDFHKVNGVTTVLRAVLEHRPSDVNVRIYTSDGDGCDREDYFAVKAPGVGIPCYREMKIYAPRFGRFVREAENDAIDLIHLTTPGPVGLAALYVASQLQLPLIGSFHTLLAEYTERLSGSKPLAALMRAYLRWSYGWCQRVLAPSRATHQVLIDSAIAPGKVRIWERGVSTERFSPIKRSAAIRQAWRATGDTPVLLYVGRLSKEKGLEEIPAVQVALRNAGVDHRLVFVGDGPMRAELEGRCPDAIFTGSLSPDDVAVAMASADLFVFPSRTDTAGNVVLEAQASGLPVLVTNDGGPRENMRDGESGAVCATTAQFAAHALTLCVDRPLRALQSERAREYALGRRWDVALAPLFQTYREFGAAAHTASPMAVPRVAPLAEGR